MKTFIVNVYKNKKWITLGLSILYLLLFCFPFLPAYIKQNSETGENIIHSLPFVLYLVQFLINLPKTIKNMQIYNDILSSDYYINFAINLACSLLMLACVILSIICLVRLFKDKKFQFVWSLLFAFLTLLLRGAHIQNGKNLYMFPTTYIFLTLLVLDIIYLILEKHYLRPDYDTRVATRKAARQAKQEAALKQSPEYRIEQLEKELQELKSQVKSDDDSQ